MAPSDQAGHRLRRILLALTPGVVYLIGQLTCLRVLRWIADVRGKSFDDALTSWDGRHFLAIAEQGYTLSAARDVEASLAFFPGLPKLMALVSWSFGVTPRTAGLLISAVAGLVAAYGLVKLADYVPGLDRAGGLILVAVFSLAPMSVVLSMTYSEALFCAFAVWSLVFLLRGHWLVAGGLSMFGGLVRPTGLALAGAIAASAVVAIVKRRATWQTWVGALIAPLGFVGYVGWVGHQLGSPLAWFDLQRAGWDSAFDFGAGSLDFVQRTLRDAPALLDVVTVALMLSSLLLLGLAVRQRQPYELVAYGALVAIQVLGTSGVMNSKGRLLIPAFTLLIPLAVFLARERRSNAVTALIVAGLASAWYSAYAVIIYGYAI